MWEIIGLTFISTTVQVYVGNYRFVLYFYDCPGICGRLSVLPLFLRLSRYMWEIPLFLRLSRYMWEIIGLTFISTTVQVYVGDSRFYLSFYDCRFDLYFYDCPGICGRFSVLPLFLRLSGCMWEIIGLTFISTTVQVYVGDYRFDLYFYDCPGICEDYRFDFYDCPGICGGLSV